ncbi:hypothetical protein Bca52824_065872 [Brassica carinata]|uniref:Uncharacterized protein n=1 Tax=Brassica carinata TaxID=52824 RepID=A0A8X7QKZ4_BRACI|nr:hypothetical protein Bca52824_065872 [Brassica carinata]
MKQGGELKSVDMLLLDVKTRWPQSSRGQSTFKLSSLFQHILQEGLPQLSQARRRASGSANTNLMSFARNKITYLNILEDILQGVSYEVCSVAIQGILATL